MKANYLLQEKAYETIKEMIKNGELEPGEIYSLNKMASQFEISRTPFRDAVLRWNRSAMWMYCQARDFRCT